MLKVIFEIVVGVFVFAILALFMFIDLIHDYCKKYVDKIEDKQIEIE